MTLSPADRLDAARQQLESSLSSLDKRDGASPASPREKLALAQSEFVANHLSKRDSALSAANRLSAAKEQFGASHHQVGKRDISAADRLHAAKDQFGATHHHVGRDLSAADKLAAAKDGFGASHHHVGRDLTAADKLAAAKDGFGASHHHVGRDLSAADRLSAAKDSFGASHHQVGKRDDPVQGHVEYPVSDIQKTVVPIVVGLVLLLMFVLVAGFIVYKRRQKNKASENAQHRRKHLDIEDDGADEDYEMGPGPRVQTVGGQNVSANRAGGWNNEQYEREAPRRRSSSLQKGLEADVKVDMK